MRARLLFAGNGFAAGLITGAAVGPLAATLWLFTWLPPFPGTPRWWSRSILFLTPLLLVYLLRKPVARRLPLAGMAECVLLCLGTLLSYYIVALWGLSPIALADARMLTGPLVLAWFLGVAIGTVIGGVVGTFFGALLGEAGVSSRINGPLYGALGTASLLLLPGLNLLLEFTGVSWWLSLTMGAGVGALGGAMAAAGLRGEAGEESAPDEPFTTADGA